MNKSGNAVGTVSIAVVRASFYVHSFPDTFAEFRMLLDSLRALGNRDKSVGPHLGYRTDTLRPVVTVPLLPQEPIQTKPGYWRIVFGACGQILEFCGTLS